MGSLFLILGWGWGFRFPINKSLWSSAYVLWTAGLACWVFSACYALVEIKHWTYWAKPFELFGREAEHAAPRRRNGERAANELGHAQRFRAEPHGLAGRERDRRDGAGVAVKSIEIDDRRG